MMICEFFKRMNLSYLSMISISNGNFYLDKKNEEATITKKYYYEAATHSFVCLLCSKNFISFLINILSVHFR
jgi:hypothetical protein